MKNVKPVAKANAVTPGKRALRSLFRRMTMPPHIPATTSAANPANGHSPKRPVNTFQSAPPIQPLRAASVITIIAINDRTLTSVSSQKNMRRKDAITPLKKSGMLIQLLTSPVCQSCTPPMVRMDIRIPYPSKLLFDNIKPQARWVVPLHTKPLCYSARFNVKEFISLCHNTFNGLHPPAPA